jgi:hypothetical protein
MAITGAHTQSAVTNGHNLFGQSTELPVAAPAMIRRVGSVTQVQDTGSMSPASCSRHRPPGFDDVTGVGTPTSAYFASYCTRPGWRPSG